MIDTDLDEDDEFSVLNSIAGRFTDLSVDMLLDILNKFADISVGFILLHELAHICLGHFINKDDCTYLLASDELGQISIFTPNYEYAADEWAVKKMSEIQETNSISFLGEVIPLIALSLSALFERIGTGGRFSRNHPSGRNRVNRLKCVFKPKPPYDDYFFDTLLALPEFILCCADNYS